MTASRQRWLLAFPPLVSTNWGSYYPSTAALAAVLASRGWVADQVDLNAELFDYLTAPERLSAATGAATRCTLSLAQLPAVAAASLILDDPGLVRAPGGRYPSAEDQLALDLVAELARALHVDELVAQLCSPAFGDSDVGRAYTAFFSQSTLVERLRHEPPDVVGISVPMGPQLGPALLLARLVKELRPATRVVLGGATLTLMALPDLAALLRLVPAVDAVVRHEGEAPAVALAAQLDAGEWRPEAVPGVVSRQRPLPSLSAGRDKAFAPAALPFAGYDATLLARLSAPRLGILQARGCYWGECAYCDFVELYRGPGKYKGRPVPRVVDEVRHAVERLKVDRFWLVTEALPPAHAGRFADALLAGGLRCDWRSFVMVDAGFTSELLARCKESGCTGLTVGLESMATRVLQLVGKKASREDNLRFLEACRAAGLRVDLNLIPNLPTTTYAEALRGLQELEGFIDVVREVAVFPFEATASSRIGRTPGRYGLSVSHVGRDPGARYPAGQAQYLANRLVYTDAGMTPAQLEDVFQRYEDFARRVRARAASAAAPMAPTEGRRIRLRSPRIALVRDAERFWVYDWDVDRAFTAGRELWEFLHWLKARSGASAGDSANYLSRSSPAPEVPRRLQALLRSASEMRLLHA
ncbi:MAG TPA: radical SAM protein [Polyangiaceae bacterium]|nr:radical SAM protein [Polyangiaceae bacterium]